MNYRKDVEKCIKFIEDHIKQNITIEEVASKSGYSLYHFCRVFSLCKGVSVMEYIRGRRLSLAATELLKGRKIIDIALNYGFETSSGFTKAFRKAFGYSSTQYTVRMAGYTDAKTPFEIGGYIMNPIIIKNLHLRLLDMELKQILLGHIYKGYCILLEQL